MRSAESWQAPPRLASRTWERETLPIAERLRMRALYASMFSSMCLRCLTRSLAPVESSLPSSRPLNGVQRAAFSTTRSVYAAVVKRGVVAKPSAWTGRTLRLTKNKSAATRRPPAPGERKAIRKRVVLSNTNALEVKGMQELDVENSAARELELLRGKVLAFHDSTVNALRALGAFKATQGWNLFRRPATLIRQGTVQLAREMEQAVQSKTAVREVLLGECGSGKSVLQLQAMAVAATSGWIVMHFPEANDIADARSSYQPLSTPDGTLYLQPHLTATFLGNFVKANQKLLSSMRLSKQYQLPVPVQSNISLSRFADLGARDPELAWPIWQALWSELTAPTQEGEGLHRPPVFISMDGIDHVMRESEYLDRETKPIHAHDLALVQHFARLLSGQAALPNGGMVLAAVSESNRPASPTLDYCMGRGLKEQQREEQSNATLPEWDPYRPFDRKTADVLESVKARKLTGLSKQEARGVMEYYAQSGVLRNAVTDGLVSEMWTLAGGGIVGQIEKASVMFGS